MQEIGIEETEAHVRELNALLIAGVDELGARVVTPRVPEQRGALVCVASTDVDRLVARWPKEASSRHRVTTTSGSRLTVTTPPRT